MGVADGVVRGIQLLWCAIVARVRIGEKARCQMFDCHCDLKSCVCLYCVQILGHDKLRGRHVCRRGDHTHRGGIARTRRDLLTVCKGQVNGQAEIDEVVGGRQRRNLA